MGGGAWPFLVGGLICLVNSDNERDHNLLNSVWNKYEWVKGWIGRCEGSNFHVYHLIGILYLFCNLSLLRGTPKVILRGSLWQ